MKARGSAIIIAMLMITAIGGIAFAIGRLLFIESTSASFYVNGSVAYYAAESGLEEGFLRYRYNRNAEVPFTGWKLDDKNATYVPGEGVFRSNLTDNTPTGSSYLGIDKSIQILSSDVMDQTYDLRMGYIGTNGVPWFGPPDIVPSGLGVEDFPATLDTSVPYYVKKDEAIKIDLTGVNLMTAPDLILHAKFYDLTGTTVADQCKALIEAKMTVVEGVNTNEYKSLISYNKTNCESALVTKLYSGSVTGASLSSGTMYYRVARLQEIIQTDNYGVLPTNSAKVTLFLKPLYYNTAIGLSTANCTAVNSSCNNKINIVSGPSTKIESTGYYGGTTRKLEADIDRQSGTLYDLFDYVIYKGG